MTGGGWWIKLGAGLLLVLNLAAAGFGVSPFVPWFEPPLRPGQALAVGGGLVHLWHQWLLRRRRPPPAVGAGLVTDAGLYRWVRHPVYLGDLLLYGGLALLAPNGPGLLLLAAGTAAILWQCRTEDRRLALSHGEAHRQWRTRTRLILPGLL